MSFSILDNISPKVWDVVLSFYAKALTVKGNKMKPEKKKDLHKLDSWYQNELPDTIQGRKPRHITQEELCKLMKWKLTRGKFRPRLTEMVATNSEDEVKSASTSAFAALPDVPAAIQALTVLKAVGPATASAILAAGAPAKAAFMADESMAMFPGLQPIKYDLAFYKTYMKHVTQLVKQLNKEGPDIGWTAHKVELTLWTFQICRTLDTDLLDQMTTAVDKVKYSVDKVKDESVNGVEKAKNTSRKVKDSVVKEESVDGVEKAKNTSRKVKDSAKTNGKAVSGEPPKKRTKTAK
ncbi:uncharacterized protein LOC128223995 isoform X1 [Mya arenaria]|uniref:uncharacterized protein LOC128223995 isoform X1 n=1 Tax=Mya arenaria TaxID=6604 RepID=UPI0022DE9AAC|nr:uncharacterized protein LOC128223995 isoform X1 [Mya arenaria]